VSRLQESGLIARLAKFPDVVFDELESKVLSRIDGYSHAKLSAYFSLVSTIEILVRANASQTLTNVSLSEKKLSASEHVRALSRLHSLQVHLNYKNLCSCNDVASIVKPFLTLENALPLTDLAISVASREGHTSDVSKDSVSLDSLELPDISRPADFNINSFIMAL
jgi:hypothetical protein